MDPTIPEPPESPRLLRPRTVGEILTDAFELYRRHWQNLFVIVAVIVIPLSFAQVSERRGDKAEAERRLRRSREAEAQGPR